MKQAAFIGASYMVIAIAVFTVALFFLLGTMFFNISYSQGSEIFSVVCSVWIACGALFIVGIIDTAIFNKE